MTNTIATLNDLCRQAILMPVFGEAAVPCRILMTQGIMALAPEDQIAIAAKVRRYDTFTEDNDPYGEHDFGAFTHDGLRIFWKIDYYDLFLLFGSDDPADPSKTIRVLTIMLAEEH